MLPFFTEYVALGDSLSIDLYPALDAGEIDVAVALERDPTVGHVAPLGAPSLLYQNDDARWPEDQGLDLVTRYPGITLRNLACDHATIGDVFGEQLAQLEDSDADTLVTLTVGGNDLFSAFANKPRPSLLDRIASDIADAYELLLEAIHRMRPNAVIVLSTVYDPSDGSGRIPGILEDAGVLPVHAIETMNDGIRRLGHGDASLLLADLHARFLGHGAGAAEAERWYWRRSLIEPSARGAHEIRQCWRDAMDVRDQDE
jgi:lysophospholipase L1-like esterase